MSHFDMVIALIFKDRVRTAPPQKKKNKKQEPFYNCYVVKLVSEYEGCKICWFLVWDLLSEDYFVYTHMYQSGLVTWKFHFSDNMKNCIRVLFPSPYDFFLL